MGHLANLLDLIEVAAAFSVLSSLAVLFTLVVFRDMRSKLFMRIIAYVSLSDMLANLPYVLPYRPRSGPWCVIQGLLNVTFYPCSWLWTAALVYLLYFLATENKFPSQQTVLYMKALCWGLPVCLTALSLSVTKYGYVAFDEFSYEICIFKSDDAAIIYHAIFYYGLLCACFLFMIILKSRLNKIEIDGSKDQTSRNISPMYKIAKTSLELYSPALLICWFPHCIIFLVGFGIHSNSRARVGLYFLSDMLKLFHGVVTAGIFFYKSPEARRLWHKLFILYFGRFVGCARLEDKQSPSDDGEEEYDTASSKNITITNAIHAEVEVEMQVITKS